jgi:hypothetical protein
MHRYSNSLVWAHLFKLIGFFFFLQVGSNKVSKLYLPPSCECWPRNPVTHGEEAWLPCFSLCSFPCFLLLFSSLLPQKQCIGSNAYPYPHPNPPLLALWRPHNLAKHLFGLTPSWHFALILNKLTMCHCSNDTPFSKILYCSHVINIGFFFFFWSLLL